MPPRNLLSNPPDGVEFVINRRLQKQLLDKAHRTVGNCKICGSKAGHTLNPESKSYPYNCINCGYLKESDVEKNG